MSGTYRVLLSCASSAVRSDLFEPGHYTLAEATEHVGRVMRASQGVVGYVVPDGDDPRDVLHREGWI